jgi:hypothetical protein
MQLWEFKWFGGLAASLAFRFHNGDPQKKVHLMALIAPN